MKTNTIERIHILPLAPAFLAAVMFGMNAPLDKLLLGHIGPVMLAAFLYLGSCLGLVAITCIRHAATGYRVRENNIGKKDFPWLLAGILTGGVAAPIVLMVSLTVTPAANASLLLNTEAAATALIAVLLFHEHVGRHAWLALVCIVAGGAILSISPGGNWSLEAGTLGVILACVLWGMDNNFTCRISAGDPVLIAIYKCAAAGSLSLLIALAVGESIPGPDITAASSILGFFSFGLSIVFYIISLRQIGAARTGTAFATAPFLAVLFSIIIFREIPTVFFLISLPLMAIGALILVKESRYIYK